MSGIAGLYHLDGKPADVDDLQKMVTSMVRRGPDDAGIFVDESAGLVHAMLWTTPEALHEKQPLINARSDLAITADLRIDNRQALIDLLGLGYRDPLHLGDAELVLHAYDKWGEDCPGRLLGDFAFVIWDRRQRKFFCARDHFGVKPFYYYHAPGRFFVFASEPKAFLFLEQVPYRINEARIADFLVTQLEGIDKTSTFFEKVYRMPPAHTLTITGAPAEPRRYWTLEPGEELRLPSDEAYAEAFLEVFTEAVRCRLRGATPVGSMLSGGMDSGSIVAVASRLLAEEGKGPLPTFSAVSPDAENCIETKTIYAALTMDNLDPHLISYDRLDELMPELEELTWNLDEPFDNHMTLVRAVYLAAHYNGTAAVLDGIDGDSLLSEGTYIARLLRAGRWLSAYREAAGHNRFWNGSYPAWDELYQGMRSAFIPDYIRSVYHSLNPGLTQRRVMESIETSIISIDFARRVNLAERMERVWAYTPSGLLPTLPQERSQVMSQPYITVAIERYNRVASTASVESRHPFLDRRMIAFCVTLPGEQKLSQGWPKAILRRAMADKLPHAVRWRRGKQHLGWGFTTTLAESSSHPIDKYVGANWDVLSKYIDKLKTDKKLRSGIGNLHAEWTRDMYKAAHLAKWLRQYYDRPQVTTGSSPHRDNFLANFTAPSVEFMETNHESSR